MAWKKYNNDDDRPEVAWNVAAEQAKHVFSLLKEAALFYRRGNVNRWYAALSALREMINHDLTKEEEKELDEMEKDASSFNRKWAEFELEAEEEKQLKIKGSYSVVVKKYQRRLMDLLKTMGFFPAKEDRENLSF